MWKTIIQEMYDRLHKRWGYFYSRISLRYVIWGTFTLTALLITIMVSGLFYKGFSNQLLSTAQNQQRALMDQVNNALTSTLRNMMKVSDSLYYSVIKDEETQNLLWDKQFQLLYDSNKDYIENIALFSEDGALITASPAALLKKSAEVTKEGWFLEATEETENFHFSNTHVQNLFERSDYSVKRVISLSRMVQFNVNNVISRGVLLVDIKYDEIAKIFDNVSLGEDGYVYIMDKEGTLIYHPRHQLILDKLEKENNQEAIRYKDGTNEEKFQGRNRVITVKSVGYTGWKLIGVVENSVTPLSSIKSILFYIAMILSFLLILSLINSFLSMKVTDPIMELEEFVKGIEANNLEAVIEEKGCFEIRHLGKAIYKMEVRIKQLMETIVKEQAIQRKNELNTLQSQINPHFLYNTLDIVIWMVENEKPKEAVRALTALARFFRIGLSKGKNIISVEKEVEHVKNYLTIQKMRYKNKFEYYITLEDEVRRMSSLKLILQPLVENAIFYGMEFKDGDGEIHIRIYKKENEILMEVEDNGLGIRPEKLEEIKRGGVLSSKKGSGIGLKNVNERIQLSFGKEYGIRIETEPDEGTMITIHQPIILYME